MYRETVEALCAEREGHGPRLVDLGTNDPGGERSFDPSGLGAPGGRRPRAAPAIETDSVDFVATDPPYNVQLAMTMAGGALAETHANRRTDYAMVSDLSGDLANLPDYAAYLDAMGGILARGARASCARAATRPHRPRRLPGRPLPVHGLGPRGAR